MQNLIVSMSTVFIICKLAEMGKITQLGGFANQNNYNTVILKIKIEIITKYEFLKSKSSLKQVILKITYEF